MHNANMLTLLPFRHSDLKTVVDSLEVDMAFNSSLYILQTTKNDIFYCKL